VGCFLRHMQFPGQFRAKAFPQKRSGIADIDSDTRKIWRSPRQGNRIMLAHASLCIREASQRLVPHGPCEGAAIGEKALAAR